MREQLLYYALKYKGEWKQIRAAIARGDPWVHVCYKGSYITILDDAYPLKLRRLQYPPLVLFYEGDISLLMQQSVGVVGSRLPTVFGLHMCHKICRILRSKYVIVSGLAKGIDACAHDHARMHHTIGVIGCGLDISYPKENEELYQALKTSHLIISEYPFGTKPYAYHFPWRNRIIVGLSDALVVVEAKIRSGTMLSVNEALEIDIPIYCVPHDCLKVEGEGCNALISQGANIICNEADIMSI